MLPTSSQNSMGRKQLTTQIRPKSRGSFGDPLSAADLEGPYASIPISNGNSVSQYESPHLLNHLYSQSNSIYSDRKTTKTFKSRSQKMNGASLKISKDSGYYSCEFLDHSNHSSPQSDSKTSNGVCKDGRPGNHYRDPELLNCNSRKSLRSGQLPPSDSGVFTLSRSYSKSNRLAQTPTDGIYDNIL